MRYNCGYNGAKGTTYEGGIRVPLIARWPDGLDGGRAFHEMVHFVDWLPTLLAAAGAEPPQGASGGARVDGQNVLPVLRGEGGKVETRRFWQWNRYTPLVTGNAAMRDGRGSWCVRPSARRCRWLRKTWQWTDGLKYTPEEYGDIRRGPDPERVVPPPPPPQLFHIDEDPLERTTWRHAEPARAAKMLAELETWFEEVEAERRTIDD